MQKADKETARGTTEEASLSSFRFRGFRDDNDNEGAKESEQKKGNTAEPDRIDPLSTGKSVAIEHSAHDVVPEDNIPADTSKSHQEEVEDDVTMEDDAQSKKVASEFVASLKLPEDLRFPTKYSLENDMKILDGAKNLQEAWRRARIMYEIPDPSESEMESPPYQKQFSHFCDCDCKLAYLALWERLVVVGHERKKEAERLAAHKRAERLARAIVL